MDHQLKTKLGQKFVIGFTGTEVTDELREAVETYHFGNFILFRDNLISPARTRALCKDLRDLVLETTGIEPLISIDQEGGMVTRLTDDRLNIPGAMALAATDDRDLTRELNRLNGERLRDLGFNLNLAPVFDINSEPDNPVIGVRSYGDDPQRVADFALAAFEGLKEGGVLAAAKHFPGHGDTKVDSHVGLPRVDADRETLEQRELIPFRRAVEAGIDAIMTTHILFPALEKKKVPATMSRRILTDLLRGELGYQGLIVSDCMEMDAIAEHYGTAAGVRSAFAAGVDLVFVSHTPQTAIESFESAYQAYASGELLKTELDESYTRIIHAKEHAAEYREQPRQGDNNAMARYIAGVLPQTFTLLPEGHHLDAFSEDKHTVVLGPAQHRATNASSAKTSRVSFSADLGRKLASLNLETPLRPETYDISRIVDATEGADLIILGLYNAHVFTEQLQLWKALRKEGRKLLLVALRNPYDLMYLEDDEVGLAIYEYTPKSIAAVADCLTGQAEPSGKLPVDLPRRTIE